MVKRKKPGARKDARKATPAKRKAAPKGRIAVPNKADKRKAAKRVGAPGAPKSKPDFGTKPGRPGPTKGPEGFIRQPQPAPPVKGNAAKSTKQLKKKVARRTEAGKSSTKAKAELKSRRQTKRAVRKYKKGMVNKIS